VRPIARLFASAALLPLAGAALAAEGMWTFDNFPIAEANRTLGTRIDQAWLDRVRMSSVRLGGCSAGLVSPEGLILTNEHCVSACVEDLSTQQVNYVATGFTPAARSEEKRCPGLTAEILTSISDVTERVQGAIRNVAGEEYTRARDAEIGRIESEGCGGDPTRRCQVVTLYRGGQFKLYTYRRYPDVRIAFAPEHRAAAFGGDLDNFSFPRFAIDAALVRIYENDWPVATPTHFRWNPAPPAAGEPVFVVGSPGATQRLLTQDQLATVAEVTLPLEQLVNSELRGRLIRFSQESAENAFIAGQALSSVENTYKRGMGRMQALIDPDFMARRRAAEDDFRRRFEADYTQSAAAVHPWIMLARVQEDVRRLHPVHYMPRPARAADRSSTIGRATSSAARRSGPSRTASGFPSSASPACRRSSSACSPPGRPIPRSTRSSSAGGCPRRARSSPSTILASAGCSALNRPRRSPTGSPRARGSATPPCAGSSGRGASPRSRRPTTR
jgi:hypothetical protein